MVILLCNDFWNCFFGGAHSEHFTANGNVFGVRFKCVNCESNSPNELVFSNRASGCYNKIDFNARSFSPFAHQCATMQKGNRHCFKLVIWNFIILCRFESKSKVIELFYLPPTIVRSATTEMHNIVCVVIKVTYIHAYIYIYVLCSVCMYIYRNVCGGYVCQLKFKL